MAADPFLRRGNAEAFLRALHLQLLLAGEATGDPRRTCCWSSATRCEPPTRRTSRSLTGRVGLCSVMTEESSHRSTAEISGHAGALAVAVARAHGVETMFTLSGAHVFPMYDGAVKAEPPMRLLDVRHEQTAAFAAEATGKLTRVPGLAVLTAGPGVTNGVSAIAQAQFAGSPLVVVGGRAPANRWGSGSLQELDHVPARRAGLQARAHPATPPATCSAASTRPSPPPGPRTAARPSSTCRWTSSSTPRAARLPTAPRADPREPDPDAVATDRPAAR